MKETKVRAFYTRLTPRRYSRTESESIYTQRRRNRQRYASRRRRRIFFQREKECSAAAAAAPQVFRPSIVKPLRLGFYDGALHYCCSFFFFFFHSLSWELEGEKKKKKLRCCFRGIGERAYLSRAREPQFRCEKWGSQNATAAAVTF